MAISVEAVYEGGVLKPVRPLPFQEHAKVRLTIEAASDWVERTAGMFGWKGSAAEADFFALDPELDHPTPPEEP